MVMIGGRGLTDEEIEVLRITRGAIGPRKKLGYMRKIYVLKRDV